MLTVLIIATIVLQAVLTGGSLAIWNNVRKSAPQVLTKTFFVIMMIRLFASMVVFALAVYLMHDNASDVKLYAIVFIVLYIALLVFDTLYFLHTIKSKR